MGRLAVSQVSHRYTFTVSTPSEPTARTDPSAITRSHPRDEIGLGARSPAQPQLYSEAGRQPRLPRHLVAGEPGRERDPADRYLRLAARVDEPCLGAVLTEAAFRLDVELVLGRAQVEAQRAAVVSLGTGVLTRRLPLDEAVGWGPAEWAQSILNVVFDGVSDTVDYQLARLLGEDEGLRRYYRLQVRLDKGMDDLDDPSHANLRVLRLLARS